MVRRQRLQKSSSTIGWTVLAVATRLMVADRNHPHHHYYNYHGASAFSIDSSQSSRTTITTGTLTSTIGKRTLAEKLPILPLKSQPPTFTSYLQQQQHAIPTISTTDSHHYHQYPHRIGVSESTGPSDTVTAASPSRKSIRSDRSTSSSSSSSSSTTSSSTSQLFAMTVTTTGIEDDTTVSLLSDKKSISAWWSDTVLPVVSCALLITGNTVGAGCLVLPELAVGPGLLNTTILYLFAYLLNVISGCILADVAITQKERITTDTTINNNDNNNNAPQQLNTLPTSLNDFATMNFQSSLAGNVVASISLFVNSCVMAFDLNRFGSVLAGTHYGIGSFMMDDANMISVLIATLIVTAMTTLSSQQLSMACSLCVTALFVSFGSVLLPGLVAVPTDVWSVFQVPGTSPDVWDSATSIFPIILMSMVFQNIIPVVVKQLHYDRTKSMSAITIGAMIPLIMYVAWCYTCLGGGIDLNLNAAACCTSSSNPLLTIFSIATLIGSSLCTGMSLAEEYNTILATTDASSSLSSSSSSSNVIPNGLTNQSDMDRGVMPEETRFSLETAIPSVTLPLIAAVVFGSNDNDNNGLTSALAIAGSLGSPLLYGFLPAVMAWRQRQSEPEVSSSSSFSSPPQYMIPSVTLPALGFLSTIFVGQEMLSRFTDLIAFAS